MRKTSKFLLIVLFGLLLVSFGCKKEKTKEDTKTPEVPTETKEPTTPIEPSTKTPEVVIDLAFINNLLSNINNEFKNYELNYTVTKSEKLVYSNNTKVVRVDSKFSITSTTKILSGLDVDASSEYKETTNESEKTLDQKIVNLSYEEGFFESLESFLKGEKVNLTKSGQIALTEFEYETATLQLILDANNKVNSITIDCTHDGYHYLYISTFTY